MQKAVADPQRKTAPNRAGARAFWQSRVTAIVLAVLVPYGLFVILRIAGRDLAFVQHSLSRPWIALPLLALILAGVWHMWLGMREILEDYVKRPALGSFLFANTVFALLVALVAAGAMVSIWLGAPA